LRTAELLHMFLIACSSCTICWLRFRSEQLFGIIIALGSTASEILILEFIFSAVSWCRILNRIIRTRSKLLFLFWRRGVV